MTDEAEFSKKKLPVVQVRRIKKEVTYVLIGGHKYLKDVWEAIYKDNLCIEESMESIDKVLEFYLPSIYANNKQLSTSTTPQIVTNDFIVVGEKCEVPRAVFENHLKESLCRKILGYQWGLYEDMLRNELEDQVSKYCEMQLGQGKYQCSDVFVGYIWSIYKDCKNILEINMKVENKGAPAHIKDLYYDKENNVIVVDEEVNKLLLSLDEVDKQIEYKIQGSSGVQLVKSSEVINFKGDQKLTLNCEAIFSSKNDDYKSCLEVALQHQEGKNKFFRIEQECKIGRMKGASVICKLKNPEVAYGEGIAHGEDKSLPFSQPSQDGDAGGYGENSKLKYVWIFSGITSALYGVFMAVKHNISNKDKADKELNDHDNSSGGDDGKGGNDGKPDSLPNKVEMIKRNMPDKDEAVKELNDRDHSSRGDDGKGGDDGKSDISSNMSDKAEVAEEIHDNSSKGDDGKGGDDGKPDISSNMSDKAEVAEEIHDHSSKGDDGKGGDDGKSYFFSNIVERISGSPHAMPSLSSMHGVKNSFSVEKAVLVCGGGAAMAYGIYSLIKYAFVSDRVTHGYSNARNNHDNTGYDDIIKMKGGASACDASDDSLYGTIKHAMGMPIARGRILPKIHSYSNAKNNHDNTEYDTIIKMKGGASAYDASSDSLYGTIKHAMSMPIVHGRVLPIISKVKSNADVEARENNGYLPPKCIISSSDVNEGNFNGDLYEDGFDCAQDHAGNPGQNEFLTCDNDVIYYYA